MSEYYREPPFEPPGLMQPDYANLAHLLPRYDLACRLFGHQELQRIRLVLLGLSGCWAGWQMVLYDGAPNVSEAGAGVAHADERAEPVFGEMPKAAVYVLLKNSGLLFSTSKNVKPNLPN